MSSDMDTEGSIEKYLRKEMDEEERAAFEISLLENPDLVKVFHGLVG